MTLKSLFCNPCCYIFVSYFHKIIAFVYRLCYTCYIPKRKQLKAITYDKHQKYRKTGQRLHCYGFRVFNSHDSVGEATRQLVWQAAP